MEIDKINLSDLIDDKYIHKKINDDMFLSDFQIIVLKRNNINPYNYKNLKELIFVINQTLDDEYDEELDAILYEIEEFYYYNCVNK